MKYIIGLGNPIQEGYLGTRHNIGADALLQIIPQHDFVFDKYSGTQKAYTKIAGEDVCLLLPQTYMNNSGEILSGIEDLRDAFVHENVLVVHDEIDIPFGELKISKASGSGGHNGVKSIIAHVGNNNFPRLRIGICPVIDGILRKPQGEDAVAHFVLKQFNIEEKKVIDEEIYKNVKSAIESWVKNGVEETANKIN